MAVLAWCGFVVGVVVLGVTASSVMKTLLVPRANQSIVTSTVARVNFAAFRLVTNHVDDYTRRDRVWSVGAPTFLAGLLAAWLVSLLLGFALVLWPFTDDSFATALRVAGSSLFTLGFAAPTAPSTTAIAFLAAASGLVVVALQIAYLPALYAAFNRRETLVTMLDAIAGTPPWGPELLARQSIIGNLAYLPRLYERWMEWAADISESHATYRTLVYFRSPGPARSWLIALVAVLDAAALHVALCPTTAPPEARLLLRMGYITIRQLARDLGIDVPDDPRPDDPIALGRPDFDQALERLRSVGWLPELSADEAWPHFGGWRVNYETAAYAIACHLDVPPAPWSGRRRPFTHAAAAANRPPDRTPT